MGKPGREGAPSPVYPGDSATRQEVRHAGPPTRSRWGGYHLARPGGLRGRKASSTRKIKPQTSNPFSVSSKKEMIQQFAFKKILSTNASSKQEMIQQFVSFLFLNLHFPIIFLQQTIRLPKTNALVHKTIATEAKVQ